MDGQPTPESLTNSSEDVRIVGAITLSAVEFCDYHDSHPFLQDVNILSVECYTTLAAPRIWDRLLLLELQRPNRNNIWLRLDRPGGRDVSLSHLMGRGGRKAAEFVGTSTSAYTRAHSMICVQAQLSAEKDLLLVGTTPDNRQDFNTLPALRRLVRVLRIIIEEIVAYHAVSACFRIAICSADLRRTTGTLALLFANSAISPRRKL